MSEWGDISISWSGIRIMYPSGVTYLSVGPAIRIDVSEWGDISICWPGIRIHVSESGVTYLSVGPESG